MRFRPLLFLMLATAALHAAERQFDFSEVREQQTPPGFRSALTGEGAPGEWRVIMDEVPPAMQPLSPQAPSVSTRPVLAQLSEDRTDERFPLLIYEGDVFHDFSFSTRFKTVRGVTEQMAGVAFRIQNETNYYVLRASSAGGTFRFYKVVDGQRGAILGPSIAIPSGVWHELRVECKGNQIRCFLNGKQEIPTITDNSFASGKVGFWTKSDSVSYFADAKVIYTPREPAAQGIVRDMLKKYKRLLGVKLYVRGAAPESTRIVGSNDESQLGEPGGNSEWDVLQRGVTYYGKGKSSVEVTMPIRDRNGEIVAAARFILRTFMGQTERNAVERAAPLAREVQSRFHTLDDLIQ